MADIINIKSLEVASCCLILVTYTIVLIEKKNVIGLIISLFVISVGLIVWKYLSKDNPEKKTGDKQSCSEINQKIVDNSNIGGNATFRNIRQIIKKKDNR